MWRARNLHYKFALISTLFIVISAVTGLMWAYAPYIYWQPGYLEKREGVTPIALEEVQIQPHQVGALLAERTGTSVTLGALTLRTEDGIPLYDAVLTIPPGRALIDARNGEILSPLSEDHAIRIARQYAPKDARVTSATLHAPWEHRKGARFEQAWIVRFADEAETEVVLDAQSAIIAEHSDRVRRFHFWVMKLHQFNFFGTHKVLSAVSGIPLLILIVTGLILALKRLRLRR